MDPRTTIRESQQRILRGLEDCEGHLATLYRLYGRAIPFEQHFWDSLADEESAHAQMLTRLHAVLEKGHLFFNIGRFNEAAACAMQSRVDTFMASARSRPPSMREALLAAQELETSMIDSRFYSTVTSDDPDFQRIADVLVRSTEHHIRRIREQLARNPGP